MAPDSALIVVDASAMLDFLLRTSTAKTMEGKMLQAGQTLRAPHLIDVEVAQVIRRYTAAGDIDAARGSPAFMSLIELPLHRYPHDFLMPRIWALRNNLTPYDAVYVCLAEVLDAPLLTTCRGGP